jgi:cell division protease FtsH
MAKDKIMMGTERKSMVMTDAEKKTTAYHEGGHAVIAYYEEESYPIHKATIIPRGRALGMVMRLPEGDRISISRNKLLADIRVAMGGRIAEEMIFGKGSVTTGASSDIRMASDMARRMIAEWGLSESLGFRSYSAHDENYLGYSAGGTKNYSEDTARRVDDEIDTVLATCYTHAETLLRAKEEQLHVLANSLLERETLTGDEIKTLLTGGTLPPLPEITSDDRPRGSVPHA